MKATAILNSDLLDIIFENRNKAYGAYELRRHYDERMKKALIGMFAFTAIVCSLILTRSAEKPQPVYNFDGPTITELPPPEVKPDEPKRNPKTKSSTAPLNNAPPVIVAKPDSLLPEIRFIENANPATGTDIGDPAKPGDGNGEDKGLPVKIEMPVEPIKPVVEKIKPIDNPEVEPAYPGGMNAFVKFLQKNLESPGNEDGSEIAVRVKFIVSYDGSLKGFEVLQSGGKDYDEEVLRVLRKMPRWIPGKTSGENVSVY